MARKGSMTTVVVAGALAGGAYVLLRSQARGSDPLTEATALLAQARAAAGAVRIPSTSQVSPTQPTPRAGQSTGVIPFSAAGRGELAAVAATGMPPGWTPSAWAALTESSRNALAYAAVVEGENPAHIAAAANDPMVSPATGDTMTAAELAQYNAILDEGRIQDAINYVIDLGLQR
jgi:hypothetical protein